MMRYIHTIVLLLIILLPLGSMAQSLEIVEEFKENKMTTVLTTYKNEFGHREKQHVLDNKFPFAVLEVYLEGDEQTVKAAKSKLSLDLGSHFTVEGVCKTYTNRIVFLISSSVRNVYMTCGDGCKEQLIFSGQTLEQNKIYYGRVKYTPAVAIPTPDPVPIKSQFFKFRLTPANASVVIISNGVEERLITKEGGFASKMLKYGSYRYRITADRYYPEEGTFEVSEAQTEMSIALHPQFGWLNASGNQSTQGAYVFATSQSTGNTVQLGTIPLTKKEMDAGEYMLHVQKEKYKDYSTALTITPGHTANISVVLEANFAVVSLSAQTGAEIYLDGERLSTSIWNGTLELGEHTIETRQAGHQTAYTVVNVTPQSNGNTILLNNPIPIYGTLIVDGSPAEAAVYVDDKFVGTSPIVINDLLIGEHELRIEKDNYIMHSEQVPIKPNEELTFDYRLENKPFFPFPITRTKVGDLYYQAVEDGYSVQVVSRSSGYPYFSLHVVEIPAKITYSGSIYSVTSIRDSAFCECDNLASITIPNSVTSIGNRAFYGCGNLTSITIPNSVTRIGDEAFRYCDNLTSITIPNSVTSIGKEAFRWCDNLTSIKIPNSVTSIGDMVFLGCNNLTSISVDKNNPMYDSRDNCNAIIETKTNTLIAGCKNTVIPNSVISIGDYAFDACDNLASITIPNSVTSIGDYAFCSCDNLASITIPNSVTSIGEYAFWSCDNLTSIKIPNSVTSIGDMVFSGCDNLTSISVDKNNPMYDSRDNCNAIIETKTNTLIAGCKNTVIPNSVISIGDYAFNACDNLASITIPNSVTSIRDSAFCECDNLTSITIPNSVTSIGNNAFSGCSKLTSITIPNSVTSIGNNAFSGCSKLTSITIPNSVTSIGDYAFWSCDNLASITIPNSLTSIGEHAFWGCDKLTSITIPNSVTSIGEEAFSGCDNLSSISVDKDNPIYDSRDNCNAIIETKTNTLIAGCKNTVIPNSVTSIEDYAFSWCDNLASITIPNSVTSIGKSAFYDCDNLTSITIPNSVTSIGEYAFGNCDNLASITIPNSVTSIGNLAFSGCSNLTSITIPNSVTSIGDMVFSGCDNLTSISVDKNNPMYDSRDNCNAIIETKTNTLIAGCKNTVIPNSVISIGDYAFNACDNLASITIPNSVTSIEDEAFSWCDNLASITIPNSVMSIAPSAFGVCFGLQTIYIPKGTRAKFAAMEGLEVHVGKLVEK